MLDPKLLRDDFERILSRLQTRPLPENIRDWPKLDARRRKLLAEVEEIRALKNRLNPELVRAKREGKDASSSVSDLKRVGEREQVLDEELKATEENLLAIELLIPNIPHQTVPIGIGEKENVVEKQWGEKPKFSFTPKPHWEIGEQLGILNFEQAAKLSGARFAVYHGDGARLERVLINFMLDHHRQRNYKEILLPFLVKEETVIGSGQLPKFEKDLFKTSDLEHKLYLIPTAEVPLCNLHRDEILSEAALPLCYTAYTPCFRAEAGSHGRDVRGLIRLHQFNKVELVKITAQETSFDELERLTRDAESILEALGLPYQRVALSSGDMGLAATKTYDLEVWLPGAETYREISSCSNTGDFQSRRTKTRYRSKATEKPKFVHMLNGSGLAVGRTFLAILENYQRADGTVIIPEVLRPYMGGQEVIRC